MLNAGAVASDGVRDMRPQVRQYFVLILHVAQQLPDYSKASDRVEDDQGSFTEWQWMWWRRAYPSTCLLLGARINLLPQVSLGFFLHCPWY